MSQQLDRDLNIVVLMGGWSSEREVSRMSGEGIVAALKERGFLQVTAVDMDRNVAQVLAAIRPDVVFMRSMERRARMEPSRACST